MSWQRIDENTYIDDTLVTCAEYQLFIDEMREKGKYHQPDHWNSSRFPVGQARKPILGVRPSDARTFCEWLMLNQAGNSRFRIPSSKEAKEYLIRPVAQLQLGYWVSEDIKVTDVAVVKEDFWQVSKSTNEPKHVNLATQKDINFVWVSDIQSLPLNLDRTSDHIRSSNTSLAVDETVFNFLDRSRTPTQRAHDIDDSIDYILENNKKLAGVLDVIAEINTLQQRIAGRSPAFEGIRLVKERIR